MRTSRLRKSDCLALLLFHYPIRCRDCHMREYVWLGQFLQVRRSNKIRNQIRELRKRPEDSTASRV